MIDNFNDSSDTGSFKGIAGAVSANYAPDILSVLTYAAGTDIGMRREENQDSFGLLDSEQFRCFFVADGMGGAKGGAEASQLAIAAVRGFLAGEITLNISGVREAVEAANSSIFERSSVDPELSGMGTTIVGLGFSPKGMLVCNVGDSRAFRVRDGKIGQMTLDHTLVRELVDAGTITEEQAERHPVAHMLTRSLGPAESVMVDCWLYPERPEIGDVYILCSDGLYNLVSPAEIAEVVLFNEGHEAISKLIDLANEAGGNDNITVMVLRVGSTQSVSVSEIEVVKIPNKPSEGIEEDFSDPYSGVGGWSSEAAQRSGDRRNSNEGGRRGSAAFRALSGAFQHPDLWRFRTAVRDARNIVLAGAGGLAFLFVAWFIQSEPSEWVPQTQSSQGEMRRIAGVDLVSGLERANVREYSNRRSDELRSEIEFISKVLAKGSGRDTSGELADLLIAQRTRQNRHRSTILEIRQEIASLIETKENLPSSPPALLELSKRFQTINQELVTAREAADAPNYRFREAYRTALERGGLSDSALVILEREVKRLDEPLRKAVNSELSRRIISTVQRLRTEIGDELDAKMRGEIVDRFTKKSSGGSGSAATELESYKERLVTILEALGV